MTDSVVISSPLIESVKNFDWKGHGIKGLLVGPDGDRTTVLAVWQNDVTDVTSAGEVIEECLAHFPCGKSVIGITLIASPSLSSSLQSGDVSIQGLEEEITRLCGSVESLLESLDRESVVVLCLYLSGQQWETSFAYLTKSAVKALKVQAPTSSPDKSVASSGMQMRLKAEIPIHLSASSEKGMDWSSQIEEECTKLQTCVEADGFAFGFDNNRALVYKGGMTLGGDFRTWKLVKDIRKYLKDAAEHREEEVSKPASKGIQKPLDVSLLHIGSKVNDNPSHAPIVAHKKGSLSSVCVRLPIDVLVEVREDLAIHTLYTMLSESLSRQISAFARCLTSSCQSDQVFTPEVFHFKPWLLETAVTVVYPREMDEDKLENERTAFHDRVLIPKDRPCFRKGSAGIFLNPTAPGGYLVNTHLGLNIPSSVKSGKVSLVEGCYSYHHYMQDRFNDDKWGCAYRSLQTIVSWFKYQGYTQNSIPSHRDIQEALYKYGDKGQKFVGSRQWIGSFEVSYVLDHLLGVSSKFINVNSGAELSTTGQQLLSHFQTQGTPVMIGGGVLAHTILGVAYDEMTGDIAFLILDPHYTGGEDLKIVQDKGWCGWKDMKFWDQTAHYNMCLPQRPVMV